MPSKQNQPPKIDIGGIRKKNTQPEKKVDEEIIRRNTRRLIGLGFAFFVTSMIAVAETWKANTVGLQPTGESILNASLLASLTEILSILTFPFWAEKPAENGDDDDEELDLGNDGEEL